jgi:glucose-1-phosphate thymidylyltransferase
VRKGIILAGGKGTRLFPMTAGINKQMQSVYDKPMIYYPLSTLIRACIQDILLISSPDQLPLFKNMLGNGNQLGLNIEYAEQAEPRGISDAFLIGEKFINNSPCALVLGDNIFYGDDFYKDLLYISMLNTNFIFGYRVSNPQDYGVVNFEEITFGDGETDYKVKSIEEKPKKPKTNFAVPGLYFYDNTAVERVKALKPSARGELEITDLNNSYIKDKKLKVKFIRDTAAWFDTGTPDSMFEAAMFIKSIQNRTGQMVGCIHEDVYKRKFLDRDSFDKMIASLPDSQYTNSIKQKYSL